MAVNQSSSQQRLFRLPKLRWPSRRFFYFIFLLIITVAYWVFVWNMERIDPSQYQLPYISQLPPIIVTIASFFSPRVLRHFIPIMLGILLAFEVAANLLYLLFELLDHNEARSFLLHLRSPGRYRGPAVNVTPQSLEKQRKESARIRAGGPGRFNIPLGHVAVTEQNGRYKRTLKAGSHLLDNFEHVHAVLDLRSHQRDKEGVRLLSSEGLEVATDVSVTFRISTGGTPATQKEPYPFDEAAVRNLAYEQTNLPGNRVGSWEGLALSKVTDILRQTVVNFPLDDLLEEPQPDMGAHLMVRRHVEYEAGNFLEKHGINLQSVRLGHFGFYDDVTSQYIAYWRTFLESKLDEEETFDLEKIEAARDKAKTKIAKEIIEAKKLAKEQGQDGIDNDVVADESIEALKSVALQSQMEEAELDELLSKLQEIQDRL